MGAIGHQPGITSIETHRLTMWQSVTNYQGQSLILLLDHRLDSGYALLRLAAELSRDVYCIGNDESRLKLGLKRETEEKNIKTPSSSTADLSLAGQFATFISFVRSMVYMGI